MAKIRISTHRLDEEYAPIFVSMLERISSLPAPERKFELKNYYQTVGTLERWGETGWQGVLRKIRTVGMDPNTNYETGESREGDHKETEGQGAGAAFIYDSDRRVLVFYHGIPRSTTAMLLKYLHQKTGEDLSSVKVKGIAKQGALENFQNATDIKLLKMTLNGDEAKAMGLNLPRKRMLWRAMEDVDSLKMSVKVEIKFDIKDDEHARKLIEEAITSETDENLDMDLDIRVSYRDAGGNKRENVDLRAELFVERLVDPSDAAYMLDNVILKLLGANYDMMLKEHPVLNL